MNVVQLLNPVDKVPIFEAAPQSQHTLTERREQQSSSSIHLLEPQTPNPGMGTSFQQSGRQIYKRKSQIASKTYRDTKKEIRDLLGRSEKKREEAQQENYLLQQKNYFIQQENNFLQQENKVLQQELDHLRVCYGPRYQAWPHGQNALYTIPSDATHRNESLGRAVTSNGHHWANEDRLDTKDMILTGRRL